MAKGFTPIIGLAVVVALAMAAVFGAMSLTNPAFAAVGAPADAELAEKTFHPQTVDNTMSVAIGETGTLDIAPHITGGGSNFDDATVAGVPGFSGSNPVTATPTVMAGFNAINLSVVGANVGRVRLTITVELNDGDDEDIIVDVTVTAIVNEVATVKSPIPDQQVVIGATAGATVDLADHFNDGRGDGVIATYTATASPTGVLEFNRDGTELEIFAANGRTAQLVAVTVVAVDGR